MFIKAHHKMQINGQVASVMIGKDITQRAFTAASHTFWEESGTSTHFFLQEIYQLLHSKAPNTQQTNIIYPTFNSLYTLSTQQRFIIPIP